MLMLCTLPVLLFHTPFFFQPRKLAHPLQVLSLCLSLDAAASPSVPRDRCLRLPHALVWLEEFRPFPVGADFAPIALYSHHMPPTHLEY
jgi:hypothetical protein